MQATRRSKCRAMLLADMTSELRQYLFHSFGSWPNHAQHVNLVCFCLGTVIGLGSGKRFPHPFDTQGGETDP